MSDDEGVLVDAMGERPKMLSAEIKDGRLEIVEVNSYDKISKVEDMEGGHMLTEGSESSNDELKYMQVLDSDKNVVVDLLNFTLVKCEDGQEAYRLVSNESERGSEETITCVLSNDDGEDPDNHSYMVMEPDEGQVVILQSMLQQSQQSQQSQQTQQIQQIQESGQSKPEKKEVKKVLTPAEILEKAKALQKAKALLSPQQRSGRGRRRRGELPAPHELLASPHFKLFLYACKLCPFKCNAIKELTAHKAQEHGGGGGKWKGGGRAAASTLQCARCPYRGNTHSQLMKHVKEKHVEVQDSNETSNKVYLNSAAVSAADVLVCGACGFECGSAQEFRVHIQQNHGVTAC